MAFADPQSLTINAVPFTLPRVSNTDDGSGRFQSSDSSVVMTISSSDKRRNRRAIRVQWNKRTPDALNPTNNVDVSMSVTLVVDSPSSRAAGVFTPAEQKQIVDALTAYLTASAGARAAQLIGGEI